MPVLSKWIVLLIDVVILSLAACTAPTPAPTRGPASEGFAIYLPAQKIAANEMLEANLSDLELEDKPILSVDDIITYSKSTHEIELTPAAYERLSQLSVPTTGVPFVVCVDRAPVYGGAFWRVVNFARRETELSMQRAWKKRVYVHGCTEAMVSPGGDATIWVIMEMRITEWLGASMLSLREVWDNEEDAIYDQL